MSFNILDTHISTLYDVKIVGVELLLFCIKNDVYTIRELLLLSEDIFPKIIKQEVIQLKSKIDGLILTDAHQVNAMLFYANLLTTTENNLTKSRLYSIFQEIKSNYLSTRAINSLRFYESQFKDENDFIEGFLNLTPSKIIQLPRIGSNSVAEIIRLQDLLKTIALNNSNTIEEIQTIQHIQQTNIEKLDALMPTVMGFLNDYHIRTQNALKSLISSCNNSINQLYHTLTSPTFRSKKLKNIGKGSINEIEDFKMRLTSMYRDCVFGGNSQNISELLKIQQYKKLGVIDANYILDIANGIGHFPLLAATDRYIKSLPDNEILILSQTLSIYEDSRNEIESKKNINISRERKRQLQIRLITQLQDVVSHWSELMDTYHYPIFIENACSLFNNQERTRFNNAFIEWLISLTDDEIIIRGNPLLAFRHIGKREPFYTLPKKIYDIFDVETFITQTRLLKEKKRFEDEKIRLRQYIKQFLRNQEEYNKLIDYIELYSKRIIAYEFDDILNNDMIVLHRNARKKCYYDNRGNTTITWKIYDFG